MRPDENEIYSPVVGIGEERRAAEPSAAVDHDPLRAQLLDAAVRVFARKGFDGTKIMDIVHEAGLSTGAVYGRFPSKEALLREAVVSRTRVPPTTDWPGGTRVADLIARRTGSTDRAITDDEAVRLEAYVTARREPEVAAALAEAQQAWQAALRPVVEAAVADGTVRDDLDPVAVLFFVGTLQMGLLVQRAAGFPTPDPEAWDSLLRTIIESIGAPADAPGRNP